MKNITNPVARIKASLAGSLILGTVLLLLTPAQALMVSADERRLFEAAPYDTRHDQVRTLLAKGVSPNAQVDLLTERAAIHVAAEAGVVKNLTAMLQAGGNPNLPDSDGNTPLHWASIGDGLWGGPPDYQAAIRLLVGHGADPHRKNQDGDTPLHAAVGIIDPYYPVIKTLLALGARPDVVDGNGLTALQRFVRNGPDRGTIVTLLLKAGADPDRRTPGGDTPLHLAIKRGGSGNADVVEALLNGGANPCLRDADGATPYHLSHTMSRIHRALDRADGSDASYAGARGCWLDDGWEEDQPNQVEAEPEGDDDSSEAQSRAGRVPAARMTPGTTFRDCKECPEMVAMSQPSLAVGKYEVTRGEFARFVQATGHSTGNSCRIWNDVDGWDDQVGFGWRNPGFSQTDRHPVTCVNWHDAQAYVEWLSGKTGKTYRLLQEAEWGAVVGSGGGAWYRGNSGKRTHAVGEKAPNEVGLYDMVGNVLEWVEDCWEGDCSRRVLRGGSWDFYPEYVRPANRYWFDPGYRNGNYGFRIARTLTS